MTAMSAMSALAFGDPPDAAAEMADALLRRLSRGDGMELWVAEADGQVVSASGSSRCPAPASLASGAARRCLSGVGAGSTAL